MTKFTRTGFRQKLAIALFSSAMAISAQEGGVEIKPQNAPWSTPKFGDVSVKLDIVNKTNQQLTIGGIRASFPYMNIDANGNSKSITGGNYPSYKNFFVVDDGNSLDNDLREKRMDVHFIDGNDGSSVYPWNLFPKTETKHINLSGKAGEIGGEVSDWTPHSPQIIIIGDNSLAGKKVNKDISGITLEQLDSILTNHSDFFYDENLHVLDTMGIHGSDSGAGFVDTWYNQKTDEPIWQIQMGVYDTVVNVNGGQFFCPDSMDVRDDKYGAGPLWLMGAAMTQEFMNIDMQLVLAKGFHESRAGACDIKWGGTFDENGDWVTTQEPGNSYYHNFAGQNDMEMGPLHYIEQSFREYVYDSYKDKFFPFDETYQHSGKYITTPGTNGCQLNSPQVANAYLISSMYMWYSWQLIVGALGEDALEFYHTAENREIGAQLTMWAWNKGFGGGFQNFVKDLKGDVYLQDPQSGFEGSGYISKLWPLVDILEETNRKSEVAGGKYPLYDGKISKTNVEHLFFGDGGNPEQGVLGTAGILHHFVLTDAERIVLWNEVSEAFDMLKGRAPSTQGTDSISFRYDYLAILRIAKKFLDLSIPIPQTDQFKTWTSTVSETSEEVIDIIAPFLPQSGHGEPLSVGGTFNKVFTVRDSANISGHEGIQSVEWTMDPNWSSNNWFKAAKDSENQFNIKASQEYINKTLPAGKDTATAWVRVKDLENNVLIDTFTVFRVEEVIVGFPPVFDSAIAIDTKGDGQAHAIELYLTEEQEEFSDKIESISNLQWSWPNELNLNAENSPAIVSGVVTITSTLLSGGAGSGKVLFDYPSKTGYSEQIQDRVGPAAQDASKNLDFRRDKDSVTISITEDLFNDFENGKAYLRFKKAGTDALKEHSSIETFIRSANEFTFVFGKDEIVDYDSVGLIPSNLIFDEKGNNPHTNSIFVELKKDGGKVPEIVSSSIYDINGDGYADSVAAVFNLGSGDGIYTTDSITTLDFSWPKDDALSSIDTSKITRNTKDIISFKEISNTQGSGNGKIRITFPTDAVVEKSVLDKIGVALRDTARFDNTNTGRKFDTLSLPITEAIDDDKLLGDHVYLQFSADTTAGISEMMTDSILVHGTDSLSALFQKNKLNDKPYTFVRLMAKKDGLADIAGNTPHPTSKWIPIVRTGTASKVTSAAMIDLLGHGFGTDVSVLFEEGSAPGSYNVSEITEVSYTLKDMPNPVTTSINVTDNGFTFAIDTADIKQGAGTGYLEIIFEDTVYTAEIIDSVGPAVTEATLLYSETEDNDVVRLLLSEKIDETLSGTLTFRLKNSEREATVDAESAKMVSDSLEVVFPFGTVLEFDSIALVENGGITDLDVQNNPASNSRLVPFIYEGGKTPTIVQAYALDLTGDGSADSIYTEIKMGDHEEADSAKDLKSAEYSWPTPDNLQNADFAVVSKTEIGLNGFSADGSAGSGKISLTFPSGIVTGDVEDRVGPVIKQAFLYESDGGHDTLKVVFSEAVKEINSGDKTLLIRDTEVPSLDVFRSQFRDSIWIFVLEGGSVTVNEDNADSVKIVHTSSLVDNAKNSAIENNQKVEIQKIRRPIGILESQSGYYDNDGNGELDSLAIVLEQSISGKKRIEDFNITFTWLDRNGSVKEYTVDTADINVDGELLGISLENKEFSSITTAIEKDRYGVVTITQPDDESEEDDISTITPRDKMAPILVEFAEYYGKKLNSKDDQMIDTLVVRFSEEVQNIDLRKGNSSDLFKLYDDNSSSYSIRVIEKSFDYGSGRIGFITSIEEGDTVPKAGHSIAIAGGQWFKDNQGNSQKNETPEVPFSKIRLLAGYEVLVYPNPYVIGSDEPNPLVENYGNSSYDAAGRLAVVVSPFQNRVGENLTGTISIYDVVGNVILPTTEMDYIQETDVLMISSDMTNRRGRALASGTYRAVIQISSGPDDARETYEKQIMIGVKK